MYMRIRTAQVAKIIVKAEVTYWTVLWFCGVSKLGVIPAGGNPAGLSKRLSSAA